MALVTRSSTPDIDVSSAQFAPQIPALITGEAIDPAAPCYVATDGKVYMSNGTAADASAEVDGFSPPYSVAAGETITLMGKGTRYRYADSGLTPGQTLYVGTTDGRLDNAATTGDSNGVAKAINATDIRVIRDY